VTKVKEVTVAKEATRVRQLMVAPAARRCLAEQVAAAVAVA